MTSQTTSRPLAFVLMLAREARTLGVMAVSGAVLFVLLTFVLPQKYLSTASVLPPERQGVGGMLSYFAANSPVAELLKGAGGSDNPAMDLFKTIVESKSISEEVAQDPRINAWLAASAHRAGGKADTTLQWMGEVLKGALTGEALRSGEFVVSVQLATPYLPSAAEKDTVRVMSAYVANRFVDALDRFNRDRLMTTAKNTRIFIEGEYQKRMQQLDSSYAHLQSFQESHKAIALPEQLAATVAAAAKLTGEVQKIETALRVEEREMGPNAPTVKALQAELEAGRTQLQKYDDGGAGEYIIALKNAPDLTRQYAGYLRETKVLEQVAAYLRSELEQQRVSEQRDLPSLQILDRATPPKGHAGLGKAGMGLIGLILGLALSILYILIKAFTRDVEERPEAHYRLINLIRTIRDGEKAVLISPSNSAKS